MKRSVVIVDDEPLMAEELQIMLVELCPDMQVAGVFHDGETAAAMIAKIKPDLVFLDIQMPGMTGLEVAEKLAELQIRPCIIFVTAFDEFAVKAFAVDALDYILKPLDEEDLQRVVRKAERFFCSLQEKDGRESQVAKPTRKFSVEKGDRMEIVDSDQIKLIYAKDRLVFLVTLSSVAYRTKLTLQEFEVLLPPDSFFRCHRNYIVNINQIKEVAAWFKKGYLLILKDDSKWEIPVGRSYVAKMKEYIQL